ncbi:P-loop NTPase fold protein [Sporosarcina cyprini]|uniref:P-loop NTPase fold protein n=1 Tax=Sporosarcina cyprini TaxID=2910523 RepID=UPI001EDD39D4|nr:P-loop NTPase fold protein [Sporosarcina cyprini]MCG3086378.1 KAP family NTPase [Sporosarcina cyprini]
MKQLDDVVLSYLSLPKTNYAIQINGPWGIGKTHYITHTLIDIIEEVHNDNDHTSKFKVCYVSLNGFSTVEQIGEAVFFELANTKNKFVVQGIKMVGKYGSTMTSFVGPFKEISDQILKGISETAGDRVKINATNNLLNYVIIFDDLERISDVLSIKEVFGYINSNYLESQYAKVIFVSNDTEIHDKATYNLTKEKIIGKTLTFKNVSSGIIEEIFTSVYEEQADFMEFFVNNKRNILEAVYFVLPKLNLRTIRFVFDTFNIFYNRTKNIIEDPTDFERIIQTIFLNVLIVSAEYKEGNILSVDQMTFAHDENIYFSKMFNKNDESSFENQFIDRYYGKTNFINEHLHFFEGITQFVLEGFTDMEEYRKQILNYLSKRKNSFSSGNDLQPIQILHDFRSFSEARVKEAQQNILQKIENGEFLASEYLGVYSLFSYFEEIDLILVEVDKDSVFEKGFEIALEKWIPNNYEHPHWREREKEENYYYEMKKALIEKTSNFKAEKVKEDITKWIKEVIEGDVNPETYKKIEFENNLFEIFIELNVVEEYVFNSKVFVNYLTGFLHHKYLKISNAKDFHSQEIPYIEKFIEQIEHFSQMGDGDIDKIFIFNISELTEQVKKVKEHVSS